MHTASREWADRVAARNAVEAAKGRAERGSAIRSGAAAPAARTWQPDLPCRYDDEERTVALSAEGKEAR